MRIVLLLFLGIFLGSFSAIAADSSEQEVICKISPACKKVCDLKIIDKFETLPPDQKQLTVQCSQDMMKKMNSIQKIPTK